jgi:hypothetical protein
MKRDEWIRVKSESELRPGMAVQLRNCAWCGTRETLVILPGTTTASPMVELPGGSRAASISANSFKTTKRCKAPNRSQFGLAISQGRLYRLADWNFDETSDDTTAPVRELVEVEERR